MVDPQAGLISTAFGITDLSIYEPLVLRVKEAKVHTKEVEAYASKSA